MERSTDRILTTHTGSLPRTPQVIELLLAEQKTPLSQTSAVGATKPLVSRLAKVCYLRQGWPL